MMRGCIAQQNHLALAAEQRIGNRAHFIRDGHRNRRFYTLLRSNGRSDTRQCLHPI